ncbi:MAG: L-arabinose isomerase [Opitutales bacterium]
MNQNSQALELWFVVGSQNLYGPETLAQVAADAEVIAQALDADASIPAPVVLKPVLTTPEAIRALCLEANAAPACAGLICWMHTFSPAKMWIGGLKQLAKPILDLHTQFYRDLPYGEIDMDFMNLHQTAHGGREFGFMLSRLRRQRKVVVGHWEEPAVRGQIAAWTRAAAGWHALQTMRVIRFGDNMREVAVTDGDKVEAEIQFGLSVNTHAVGDLVETIRALSEEDVAALCETYAAEYELAPELAPGGDRHESLRHAARMELGLRAFIEANGAHAVVDCFQDLHGLDHLPGLPVQRLMADGYGFGPEGDWKTAALVRTLKVMTAGADAGTSFMEDYTYHLAPGASRCLGAHMLELCPSLADGKPSCEIHPLSIGEKGDPVRLVFDGKPGEGWNLALMDMGNRFRLLASKVRAREPEAPLPKLPVARVLWDILPDLPTGVAAWIHAGGAHHTAFSYSVTREMLEDFAAMADVELMVIDETTDLRQFLKELRWNDTAYSLRDPRAR